MDSDNDAESEVWTLMVLSAGFEPADVLQLLHDQTNKVAVVSTVMDGDLAGESDAL